MTSARSTAERSTACFLAELPVDRLQVREIDAAEGPVLSNRLPVVEGDRQEFVKIDVFEIESLEHVVAAAVQQLRHLDLVTIPVEFGLDLIGRRGDLTQGQTGCEDFGEDGFHWSARLKHLRLVEPVTLTCSARRPTSHL
jgi:hypothetical protein